MWALLALRGSGSLTAVTSITLNGGTSLTLDNTASALARLGNSVNVTSNGGTLLLNGNGTTRRLPDSVGTFTVGSGAASVNIGTTATTTTLTINNLARNQGGTVNFNLAATGAGTGVVALPNQAAGLIGPWASIGNGENNLTQSGTLDFATVAGGVVTPLSAYNTGPFTGWNATDNVKVNNVQALTAATTTVNTVYSDRGRRFEYKLAKTLVGRQRVAS